MGVWKREAVESGKEVEMIKEDEDGLEVSKY